MRHILVNLKRFDVPAEYGGINRLAPIKDWGGAVIRQSLQGLAQYEGKASFTFFLPEAHLLAAVAACPPGGPLRIGCQGVYREDIAPDGNFGAFTANRPAAAAKALGCEAVMIGHCEERRDIGGVLAEAGAFDADAVNRILNKELLCAAKQGLRSLYCIGETAEEQPVWQEVLSRQLATGLQGVPAEQVVIAYEPVWAIGPGKTPPGREYIQKIASYIKEKTGGLPVVYGGGLKADNAAMLASIPEIDGGLIALTRFAGEIGFYPEEYLEIVRLYLGE